MLFIQFGQNSKVLRALALVVLKNYIAIINTTNHKNGVAMVEL